ncbi:hypothetical protein TNCV_3978991, partial [Trichonephila clavipes]
GNEYKRGAIMRNPIPHQTTILGVGPVWRMHSATVQQPLATVSPNSNPIIVMCPAEEGFVSKHNVVLFHCPCLPFIVSFATQTPVVSSKEKKKEWTPCENPLCCKRR